MLSLDYENLLLGSSNIDKTCGSVLYQIIFLTKRIDYLMIHLKFHKKDFHSKRGLISIVNRRKKLLKYIKNKNDKDYNYIINLLNLRK